MGEDDNIEHPPRRGDSLQKQGQELTANTLAPDSLTSGLTLAAIPQNVSSVSSAIVTQAADAAPHPGTVAAVSKVRVPNQVEGSQGSFAALNKLLHSFTTGSPKTLKKEAKKASALTDAQIADIRYTSKAAFTGSAPHILHRGTNYIVYIATAQETGLKLLLKAYDIGKMTQQQLAAVKAEIDTLTRLTHTGIARCRGSWSDEKHLYSVEEYGIRGDLFIEMFSERQRLTERFIACKVVHPLLQALVYIHRHNIVHRSILPENLHFDKDLNIKLTHFASALDLEVGHVPQGPEAFSVVDYLAPEILKHAASHGGSTAHTATAPSAALHTGSQLFPFGEEYTAGGHSQSKVPPLRSAAQQEAAPYNQKVDIWAVGCLLFELLTGKGPFEVADKELTCALILWADIQHFPDKLSQPCVSFIQACLTKDPKGRPSAEELLQHDWLVRQMEAEAAGIPEGLEFKPAEQQVPASSATWVTRQLSKLRGPQSSSNQPAGTSRSWLHMPRLSRVDPVDVEMGEYSASLHADIKRKFGAVNPMHS